MYNKNSQIHSDLSSHWCKAVYKPLLFTFLCIFFFFTNLLHFMSPELSYNGKWMVVSYTYLPPISPTPLLNSRPLTTYNYWCMKIYWMYKHVEVDHQLISSLGFKILPDQPNSQTGWNQVIISFPNLSLTVSFRLWYINLPLGMVKTGGFRFSILYWFMIQRLWAFTYCRFQDQGNKIWAPQPRAAIAYALSLPT